MMTVGVRQEKLCRFIEVCRNLFIVALFVLKYAQVISFTLVQDMTSVLKNTSRVQVLYMPLAAILVKALNDILHGPGVVPPNSKADMVQHKIS